MDIFNLNRLRIAENFKNTYRELQKAEESDKKQNIEGYEKEEDEGAGNTTEKSEKMDKHKYDKVMSEFNAGKLKDSHGNIVTDKGRAKAIAIAEAKDDAEKAEDDNPCWDGYEMVGMKTENGKEVPNCVPKKELKKAREMQSLGMIESVEEYFGSIEKAKKPDIKKKSNEPITITHKKTGKQITGVWRTAGGNKIFVSTDGKTEIAPDHVKDYKESKISGGGKDSSNNLKIKSDKELNDMTIAELWDEHGKAEKVMNSKGDKDDVTNEVSYQNEIMQKIIDSTNNRGKKSDVKNSKLQKELDKRFLDIAKNSKNTKEFMDKVREDKNVPSDVANYFMNKFGTGGASPEKAAERYLDYAKGKVKKSKAVSGKDSSKENSSTKASQKKIDKFSDAAASISMPSTFIFRAVNDNEGDISLTKNPELIKYVRDNYGETPAGSKRSITSALQAFHKNVRDKKMSEIKLTPSQQSEVDRYERKIEKENKLREEVKQTNKVLKKFNKDPEGTKQSLKEMGYSDSEVNKLIEPNFAGKRKIPSFVNQNASGRIKNYKEQIEKIKASAKINNEDESSGAMKEGDTGVHGINFENDTSDERVRLKFDGKPSAEARSILKRKGFKWSPKNSAWQRKNNTNGHAAVKNALDQLKEMDSIMEKSNRENNFFESLEVLGIDIEKSDVSKEHLEDMVAEHERLIAVMESESKEDDKEELKKQKKELKEYKKDLNKACEVLGIISKGEGYTDYPDSAKNNAQQVLDWEKEHGDEVKGMTSIGWARARQIANGESVSREELGKIAAFARHKKNAKVDEKYEGEPWKDAGRVAWLGWGGDPMINWAESKLNKLEKED